MTMQSLKCGMRYLTKSYKRTKSGRLMLRDVDLVENEVPIEGLNHMLSTEFKGVAQVASWYLAPFEGNYTPNSADTAAAFPVATVECTAYAAATRVLWVPGSVAGGALDSSASPAIFDMTGDRTVYGVALLSAAAKGATTGVLSSIARFTSPKINQDRLEITGGYVLESA
jgi:hypothetical protein